MGFVNPPRANFILVLLAGVVVVVVSWVRGEEGWGVGGWGG